MKRTANCGIAAGLAALLVWGGQAFALTPVEIADLARPSVVVIRVPGGLGTGFVVSKDGRIATNLHVMEGAHEATVILSDKRELSEIEVMAVDELHDLIVLRVAMRSLGTANLVPLTLGDSSKVRAGERVVAIGNPLGLDYTVSDGLVSAVRAVTEKLTVLQISAPISPGSSGGPLFNERGEVIGISTLIVTQGQNLNFGIPVNELKPLLLKDKPTKLSALQPSTGSRRKIPHHELSLLDGCAEDDLVQLARSIGDAIELGAPLYNAGNVEACYRIYAAAALDMQKSIPGCAGPKRALLDGVHRADGLKDANSRAWAMRDAFDGVLEVARRAHAEVESGGAARLPKPPPRNVPLLPLSALEGCSVASEQQIGKSIEDAIELGAPLYNDGNLEACYRVYAGAVLEVKRSVGDCAGPKDALENGLAEAAKRATPGDKAWAVRDAFDGVLGLLERGAKAAAK